MIFIQRTWTEAGVRPSWEGPLDYGQRLLRNMQVKIERLGGQVIWPSVVTTYWHSVPTPSVSRYDWVQVQLFAWIPQHEVEAEHNEIIRKFRF